MRLKNIMLFILMALVSSQIYAKGYKENSEVESKIKELLSKMTIEEKVGQMTQITLSAITRREGLAGPVLFDMDSLRLAIVKYHVGSILNTAGAANSIENWHEIITAMQDIATKETRLGIPILYGIDAIHGMNYAQGSTLFPQSIALAATRNIELVTEAAAACAVETKYCGIPWNFNPVLGLARQPLWSRHWETFGEDVYLTTKMGEAYIKGQQGDDISGKENVATCMKHYLGYSVPVNGLDRTVSLIPERHIEEMFLMPFKAAVDAGAMTVMINSGEINGIPTHSDYHLLTEVLKEKLGYKGFAVSDWEDIKRLHTRDMVASTPKEAVKIAVMAGVDMSMVPNDFSFYELLLQLVKDGDVPESRIDDAVTRILRVKLLLNLWDKQYPDKSLAEKYASTDSKKLNLEAAREAVTLLKNNGTLPLSKDAKVLITGPNANLMTTLNGGWTRTWQGNVEELMKNEKFTILDAIMEKVGKDNVIYEPAYKYGEETNCKSAFEKAAECDVIIACVGEQPYCETPGNIKDLNIDPEQTKLVKAMAKTGKPVVLVVTEGRPRVITEMNNLSQAVLTAYLPGNEGGKAIADVLFGDYNPNGKLPFTYPKFVNGFTTYDHKPLENLNGNVFEPLYSFGHGLSYTEFTYSKIEVDKKELKPGSEMNVTVEVTNSGKYAGMETVELYIRDMFGSVTRPVKQLKRFTKILLQPGEKQKVEFSIGTDDLMFVGRDNKWILEEGDFELYIADKSASFKVTK